MTETGEHTAEHPSAEHHGDAHGHTHGHEKVPRLAWALVGVVVALLVVNQFMIVNVSASTGSPTGAATALTGIAAEIIPTGVPAVYGAELGVSYDDVSADTPQLADETINKMAVYDRSITLDGELQERYIDIAGQISCEYCCGAKAIIFSDGRAACGCAHSQAMRGLAKYLLQNHPEMSDDAILTELAKWKVLFFPGALTAKAEVLKQQGIELTYINLASNKYRGIEKGQTNSGSMVGGC